MPGNVPRLVLVRTPLDYEWQGEMQTLPDGKFNAWPVELGPSLAELETKFWIFDRMGDVGDAYAIAADIVTEWERQERIEFQP